MLAAKKILNFDVQM